jgi:hypothetical protein
MFETVQVETTTCCNSRCFFCPHERFKKFTHMDEGLYRKIVDDASQYPLKCFIPMLTGEPFCDPGIMGRVNYARWKLRPETVIRIFTNGSLLTEGIIDELAGLGGIEISISVNGPTREIRRELMELDDFDEVVEMAEYADRRGILANTTTVWAPTMNIDDLNKLVRLPKPSALMMHNWTGRLYPYRRTKPTNCGRIPQVLSIRVDGSVNLCCFDAFGDVNFGNMKEMTLREAWESPGHLKYLEMHGQSRGQELPLCEHCTQG